jgi:hypothetical protein
MRSPPYHCVTFMIVLGGTIACGILKEVVLVSSTAPNTSQKLIVSERLHAPDASLDMKLIKGDRVVAIYRDNGDRAPALTEVYWSPNSRFIGVLVCDPFSAQHQVIVGYDSVLERTQPSIDVIEPLKKLLVARYGLSPGDLTEFSGDPISWACNPSSGAFARFTQKIGVSLVLPSITVER